MLEHGHSLTPNTLTSSLAVSPAKILATPEKAQDSPENEADYFTKPCESFASWNQDLLCWKTSQRCLLEGWETFSGRWPRSGTMLNGTVYRQQPLVRRISAIGSSSFVTTPTVKNSIRSEAFRNGRTPNPAELAAFCPTPTAGDAKNSRNATANRQPGSRHNSGTTLCDYVTLYPTPTATDGNKWNNSSNDDRRKRGQSIRLSSEPDESGKVIGGRLNPQWVEWLMGFPIGWTDLEALETP